MSSMPTCWAQAPIGDVCVEVEQREPGPTDRFFYVDIGSIDRDRKRISAPNELIGVEASSRARKVIRRGDVLVSMTRPNLNAVALVPTELDGHIASTGFDVLRTELLDPRWLLYTVRTVAFVDAMTNLVQGALYPAVRSKDVRSFIMPVAPLAEQSRIADKLDTVLARVDACRERLDRVPAIISGFKESVRSAALRGELTKAWRIPFQETGFGPELAALEAASEVGEEDLQTWLADLPSSWTVERASKVVEQGAEIVYGIVQPGPKLSEGVPYVRGMDIVDGQIQVAQLLRTSPSIAARYARASIRGGDVLLGIIRATKVAIVPTSLDGANITQGTARFRPSSKVLTDFLAIALEAPETQRWLHAHYRGIDMPGLNLTDVRRVPIPLPPLEEQAEIVRRVESLFASADAIGAKWRSARTQVERLTPALLTKAFRGELVQQDPDDEPASVLLERIAAARAESATRPKRKPQPRRSDLNPASDQPLLSVIDQMGRANFTFEELRQHSSRGYDSLRSELFALLANTESGVEQYFDEKERSMKLRRVRK